jgi:peroxiredoxin
MMVLDWKERKRMTRKNIFCSFFIVLFFFNLSFASERSKEELFIKMRIQSIQTHQKTPNFRLEDLEGKKMGLKDFKGKVVFLNFWATWCSPCKEEMPSIERLQQKFREKDFIFLTISVDYEGRKSVKEFINKKNYTFLVLLDPKCEILDLYKVQRIPTTFIIDKTGKIMGQATGPRDWNSPEAILLLNSLIEN